MRKVKEDRNNKRLFTVLFVIAFLFLSVSLYFLGKYFDKTPKRLNPIEFVQEEKFQYLVDFETYNNINSNCILSKDRAFSGKHSGISDKNNPYGPSITISIPTNDTTEIENVNVRFWMSPNSSVVDAVWVFTIVDQNNNQLHWDGLPIKGDTFADNNWYSYAHSFNIPKKFINTGLSIKMYLWNKASKVSSIYFDDVSISLKSINYEEGLRTKLIDFESSNGKKISSKYAKSGFYSTYAKGKDSFSESIIFPLDELEISNLHSISFSFSYLSESKDMDAVFVISICDSTHKDLLWQGVDLSKASFKEKTWETANGNVIIAPEIAKEENFLKIYLWNRNDNQVFIDDVYLVIKENDLSHDTVLPAFNMMKEKKFQPKANHPPYDIKYIYCNSCKQKEAIVLNKIFTKNSRLLVDRFDKESSKDQIFYSTSNDCGLVFFEDANITINNSCLSEKPNGNTVFYADEGYLFSCLMNTGKINMYRFDKNTEKFELVREIDFQNSKNISSVLCNSDNTVSVFENNGDIYTVDEQELVISHSKPINHKRGNVKILKADFFNRNNEVLIIYVDNEDNKYAFLNYDRNSKNWHVSSDYKNSGIQTCDKLDFISDYYIIKDDNSGRDKLLQFNRNLRFDLKVVNFEFLTYNILYNIDFKGFPAKQNPKYYEYSKIICGDFCGDSKSEIIIFQDNINRVDWLTQKTEIYSFND